MVAAVSLRPYYSFLMSGWLWKQPVGGRVICPFRNGLRLSTFLMSYFLCASSSVMRPGSWPKPLRSWLGLQKEGVGSIPSLCHKDKKDMTVRISPQGHMEAELAFWKYGQGLERWGHPLKVTQDHPIKRVIFLWRLWCSSQDKFGKCGQSGRKVQNFLHFTHSREFCHWPLICHCSSG